MEKHKGDKEFRSLKDFEVPAEYLRKLEARREHNALIQKFYKKYVKEPDCIGLEDKFRRKIESMADCNRMHLVDVYHLSKIKDWQKTNLCRDKFCYNCKVVKSAQRRMKFFPHIEKQKELGNNIYHVVLTAPNVTGETLSAEIKKIFKKVAHLIEFLKGKKKIKGLDFSRWGYEGAIRSLEVTFKSNIDWYHPHIHMLICTNEQFLSDKTIKNIFSKDRYGKKKDRLFAPEEILIQKIWYLLMNDQKVTLNAINQLQAGYSCMIDEFKEDGFHELFKYMTKTNKGNMNFENFKVLYESLLNVRQIQGYGCFFGITDDDEDLEQVMNEIYEEVQNILKQKEDPELSWQTLQSLINDKEYTLISRKKITKEIIDILKTEINQPL